MQKMLFREFQFFQIPRVSTFEKMSQNTIVKKDICKKTGDKVWFGLSIYNTEPVFVPNPNGVAEDDGVLLVISLDGPRKKSFLQVIDAKTFKTISYAYFPTTVPFTLHGHFYDII